jgi:hypothetical protein
MGEASRTQEAVAQIPLTGPRGFSKRKYRKRVEKEALSSEARLFHTHKKRVEKNRLGNSLSNLDTSFWKSEHIQCWGDKVIKFGCCDP